MGKHDIAVNKIVSKDILEPVIIQSFLEYEQELNAIDFGLKQLVNKQAVLDLIATGTITRSEITKTAATPLPITLVNGTDFNTTAKTPIVSITVKKNSTTKTTNGSDYGVEYNYTDSTMTVLASITILDNGVGELEFDTTFTVV
jgi:hypothetical protein